MRSRRFNIPCLVAVFFVGISMLGGCAKDTPVALTDSVKAISRSETNAEVLKSWVIADKKADVLIHIDTSDDMKVIPESYRETMKNASDHLKRKNVLVIDQIASFIENGGTVNLGYKAGLYKRVIWVLPASVPIGESPVESFKRVLYRKRNYSKLDLADLSSDGINVTGTIDGIPITFTTLQDLVIDEGESAIIDIDLGYFIGQKAQENETRMGTRYLIDFLRALKRKRISTSQISINLASISGAVPFDIRFFGDMMVDIFEDPGILEGQLPQKYTMMIEAEDALIAGDYGRAIALYQHLTERDPSDAGLFFSRAVAESFSEDGEAASASLLSAYDLDPAYLRGFFQLARILAVNGKIKAGETILDSSALKKLIPEEELDYQKGIFFFNGKLYYDALVYLEMVAQKRPKDFALRTVMYQAYKATENIGSMTLILEQLIKLDQNRVLRDMPWVYKELGMLSEQVGMTQRALEAYDMYLKYVPKDKDAESIRKKIDDWQKAGYSIKP